MHSNVLGSRQYVTFTEMLTQSEVQHTPHTEKQGPNRINHSKFCSTDFILVCTLCTCSQLSSQVNYSYIDRALINLFVHFHMAYNNKKLPVS